LTSLSDLYHYGNHGDFLPVQTTVLEFSSTGLLRRQICKQGPLLTLGTNNAIKEQKVDFKEINVIKS